MLFYRSQEFAANVTFLEFVRYVLWEPEHHPQADIHWRTQYEECQPCHIKYDYIGHYETMQDDAKVVLQRIATESGVQFPQQDRENRRSYSHEYLGRLFENVPIRDIRRILHYYRNDYKVLGYEIPDVIQRRLDNEKPIA